MLSLHVTPINTKQEILFVHPQDAQKINAQDRVLLRFQIQNKEIIAYPIIAEGIVKPGEIGVPTPMLQEKGIPTNAVGTLFIRKRPASYEFIRRKAKGGIWSKEEIDTIIKDISTGYYSDHELTMFVLTQYFKGLTSEELVQLTKAIATSGVTVEFGEPAYDKHSIGGVPGNKVSLLIVPIIAAAGLLIPKSSSRAITSPAGTADTMEVLAHVNFTVDELYEIAPKTRGMIFWGGSLDLAPVDDVLIDRVKKHLKIDPRDQMLSAIIAKKIALGIDHLVMDLPTGPYTKLQSREEALKFAYDAVTLAKSLDLRLEAAVTYGEQPVGKAIGPALEAKEAILTLQGKGTTSVLEKSIELAGILLEMGRIASPGKGRDQALELVTSGKAYKKFKEIVEAQGGNPNLNTDDLPIGHYKAAFYSPRDGYIVKLDTRLIARVASLAGAPSDKGAGVLLKRKVGEFTKKGDVLFEVFSNSETRVTDALNLATTHNPYTIEGAILDRVRGSF